MVFLIVLLNLFISTANAYGCGRSWNETRYAGGFPHFMNWMGAIMSACGFTNCYAVIVAFLVSAFGFISNETLIAFLNMQYLIIIIPVIGSGLAILIESWKYFWKERNFVTGINAAWNTYAMVYNVSNAVKFVPEAISDLISFDSDSDSDDGISPTILVFFAAVAASILGILTTRYIIQKVANSVAINAKLTAE